VQDGSHARVEVVKRAAANGRADAKDFILKGRCATCRRGEGCLSLRSVGHSVRGTCLRDCLADCWRKSKSQQRGAGMERYSREGLRPAVDLLSAADWNKATQPCRMAGARCLDSEVSNFPDVGT